MRHMQNLCACDVAAHMPLMADAGPAGILATTVQPDTGMIRAVWSHAYAAAGFCGRPHRCAACRCLTRCSTNTVMTSCGVGLMHMLLQASAGGRIVARETMKAVSGPAGFCRLATAVQSDTGMMSSYAFVAAGLCGWPHRCA
jgi:hypothetical protein